MSDNVGRATIDQDRADLNQLGYAQELRRKMGWFSNFAISFSIISILAGGLTSFWLGMVDGRSDRSSPSAGSSSGSSHLLVGMSMGEICSAYPTAGGLYYWSAKLARKNAAQVVVVHRVLQPARPDRRHRFSVDYALVGLHRLLHPDVRRRASSSRPGSIYVIFLLVLDRPRPAQHVRRAAGQDPRRHQRVVARRRRGRSSSSSCSSLPTTRAGIGGAFDQAPPGSPAGPVASSSRSTSSRSACCSPSTRSPVSTRRPTSVKRPSVPAPKHRRRSCERSTCRRSPRSC